METRDDNKPFPCTQCGECCRSLLRNILSQKNALKTHYGQEGKDLLAMIEEFPYALTDLGWCEMLNEDNTCKVYADRPRICRVNVAGRVMFPSQTMEDIHRINAQSCNTLIDLSIDIPKNLKNKFKVRL